MTLCSDDSSTHVKQPILERLFLSAETGNWVAHETRGAFGAFLSTALKL